MRRLMLLILVVPAPCRLRAGSSGFPPVSARPRRRPRQPGDRPRHRPSRPDRRLLRRLVRPVVRLLRRPQPARPRWCCALVRPRPANRWFPWMRQRAGYLPGCRSACPTLRGRRSTRRPPTAAQRSSGARHPFRRRDPPNGDPGSWALPLVVPSALPVGIAPLAGRLVLVDTAPAKGMSRLATIGTDLKDPPTIIDLKGQFEFDAVGPNARYLYLIEQIGGGHYQVRSYDLQMGRSSRARSSTSARSTKRWRVGRSPAP